MAIFDELKSIAKTLREADKIEQYQQILDVQEKLLEMQKRIIDLEKDNRELKNKLEIKENLYYKNSAYWVNKEDKKDGSEGPFCSHCWDVGKNTVRMHQRIGSPDFYSCPECHVQIQMRGRF